MYKTWEFLNKVREFFIGRIIGRCPWCFKKFCPEYPRYNLRPLWRHKRKEP